MPVPQGIATVNVFRMTIIVDEMRAAQALTGLTTKEWRIPNLLHELPRV
jgi:hypothetical protein